MIALETDFGPMLAPFWTPKSDQNRPQEGSEIDPKNVNQIDCFWARSWVDFGPFWAPNSGAPGGPTNHGFGIKSAPGATQGPKWPPTPSKVEF